MRPIGLRGTPRHHTIAQSKRFEELRSGFATPGYSCLDAIETAQLRQLEVGSKDVAQLCCNNGRELLSIKNLGAKSCVGFDQSAAFLAQARELAAAGNIACTFVETDVYRISDQYDAAFDLVAITIGVFGWMPDLAGFLAVVARLLRPGGALFAYEQHPIMNMFEPEDPIDPHRLAHSYFKSEPFEESGAIVYDGAESGEGAPHYWFVHTMADVLTACLRQGLTIQVLREFPHNISSTEFDIYDCRATSWWLANRRDAVTPGPRPSDKARHLTPAVAAVVAAAAVVAYRRSAFFQAQASAAVSAARRGSVCRSPLGASFFIAHLATTVILAAALAPSQ